MYAIEEHNVGRATQGVRIMRLKDGDKVASVALIGEAQLEQELEQEQNQATE